MRLDVYLAENGFTKSRSQAAECIKAGLVKVGGETVLKASFPVGGDDNIELLGKVHDFVGRGGVKLDYALSFFELDVGGMRAVDIGASTGGFTDCLLKRGAAFSVAVDCGHGQLDPSLAEDKRVRSLEGFNAKNLTPEVIGFKAGIAVADVSFISQTMILPPAYSVLKQGGIYIGLVKPQFECGVSSVGKNGVVKDKNRHFQAVLKVARAGMKTGFSLAGIVRSPVTGGDGNVEFLIYMTKGGLSVSFDEFEKMAEKVCL